MSDPFADLPKGHFAAIYADPPWLFETWSDGTRSTRAPHYDLAGVDALAKLPVRSLAADDSVLFMWVTWPLLADSFKLIEAWGFTYKTCAFSWVKAKASQLEMFQDSAAVQVGLGYWTRANSEVCLLATRGKPKRRNADVRQAIIEPRRQHSRKPDCVYQRIERLVDGPYLELFARCTRPGWSSWGNQIDKFGEVR